MTKLSGCPRMLCLPLVLCGFLVLLLLPSTCQGSPKLLFSNRKDILLIDSALADRNRNTTVLLSGLGEAAAIDFLYTKDRSGRDKSTYCWSEHYKGIFCVTAPHFDTPLRIVSTASHSSIPPGTQSPDGLAIDWVTEKLYWVDSGIQTIEVCQLRDGSHRKVLYYDSIDQPRALSLDPSAGYMYWTDWGEDPKIERAGMNGDLTTRSTIIAEKINWPNGLTIDYVERKMYWVDAQLSYIHSADLDGSNRSVVKNGSLAHPFAITVYEDRLYWTDWMNKSIFTCSKVNCSTISKIQGNLYSPMDIDVFEPTRQPPINNPCAVNNGGCSHLCLLAPVGGTNCACPTGTLLSSDNLTCADVHEMIFLARRFDLRMISLDTPDFTDSVIAVEQVSHAIAIDFDPVERYVYWTDDEVRLIQRARLDGTGQQTIVSAEVLNPDGIAVDWISGNIFWTDTGTDRIEVARLNGTSRRVIISDNLDEPRAIAVDPVHGLIYWTDWGTPAKIEKAAMDGSMRETIINKSLIWPNGIALDYEHMRLYWADAKLDKIERSNLDGSDRTVIVDSQLPHVFGFGVAGKYIYWTDWQRRTIERVDKLTPGGPRQLIVDQLPDLMAIRAIAMKPNDSYTNGCAVNNGMCSELCLNTPNGAVCACPMGMELYTDNYTCIVPEAFLVFSQPKMIKRASIQYAHKDTTLPIQHLMNITALDIHVEKELLYFADNINRSIRHACLNGSAVTMVLQFTKESPAAMVVDWISSNLYFIDDSMKLIEVYNVHANARKVVVWEKLGDPRNIGLHPVKGLIYWTDWNFDGSPVIGRANLDGSEQRSILTGIGRCGSINVDVVADRIYWVNYDKESIQSADLNGDDLQTIKGRLRAPLSVNIYGDYIYWYDVQDKIIRRVHKVNRTDEAVIQTDINAMINLLVFHKSRQGGFTNCMTQNGGCQYFCFSTGRGVESTCGCPTHYLLNRDNKTCSAPKNFLLLSERVESTSQDMQIKRLLDSSMPDLVLPMRSLRSVKTLEYDSFNNKIYWIVDSGKFKAIRRSSVDGSDLEMFLHDSSRSPTDMAIEPYSRYMYWVDSGNHVINVTTLNRVAIGVIYSDAKNLPVALAISPLRGYLFFVTKTDPQSRTNKVLRSYLDGSKVKTVAVGQSITALAVDQERDRVYYSELGTRTIKSCNSDGANVRTLVRDVSANTLDIYSDKLYYAQDSAQLYFVDKISGRHKRLVMRGQTGITDLHAVNSKVLYYRPHHPCATNNGDCSHICFIGTNGLKKCGCPKGLILNMNRLSCEPIPTCKPTDFVCSTGQGQVCIPYEWRCDGSEECADGSDERDCPTSCAATEFTCGSGECIDKSRVCNRIADCTDSSDEKTTCCAADKFMCADSLACIPTSKRKDSVKDCKDGSDEVGSNPSAPQVGNPYAVGIIVVLCIVSVFILFIIVFIVWKCHKRSASLRYADPIMLSRPVTSLDSLGTGMMDPSHHHVPQSVTATTIISASSATSAGAYDRNHVTGASSSSSSMTHLQAGFNPPPSPVTERSAFLGHTGVVDVDDCSTLVSSAYPTYHPHNVKRLNVKVPPTTPISTCDDSEPSMVNYSTQRPRLKRKSNKKYHLLKQSYGIKEPQPPPPTPSRSQICSADEEASECPPSPSTVRSFRSTTNNPYPPPPSPEPTSDNS